MFPPGKRGLNLFSKGSITIYVVTIPLYIQSYAPLLSKGLNYLES